MVQRLLAGVMWWLLIGVILLAANPAALSASASDYNFLLKFENKLGGRILLVDLSKGEESVFNTYTLGEVLRPATGIRSRSFRATLWGKTGAVVASAVNAIHIKASGLADLGRGSTISILPRELNGKSLKGNRERLYDYAIYTSIPSGVYLFGGSFSPPVGSEAWVLRAGEREEWGVGFSPQVGDVLVIEVRLPSKVLTRLSFDNREDGYVRADFADGTSEAVARVLRPLAGVGRFSGTVLAPAGAIRAAHTAVIDISTSPRGQVGGFQIIPFRHSQSPEMVRARLLPMWLVVDSLQGKDMMGTPPLFGGYLAARTHDRAEPPLTNLAGKQVEVRTIGGLPEVRILADFGEGLKPLLSAIGRDYNALRGLKRLVVELGP